MCVRVCMCVCACAHYIVKKTLDLCYILQACIRYNDDSLKMFLCECQLGPSLSTCSWKMTTYVLSNRNKKVVFSDGYGNTRKWMCSWGGKQANARTHARTHARTRARAHTHTHTHAHTQFLLSQKRDYDKQVSCFSLLLIRRIAVRRKPASEQLCADTSFTVSAWRSWSSNVSHWLHCYCMSAEKWRIVR
jgi:hypothetical protein